MTPETVVIFTDKSQAVDVLTRAYEAMGAVPDALRALDQPAEFGAVTSRARDALAITLTAIGAAPTDRGVFDLADRDLREGDIFRWPAGVGASHWRITAVINPRVDEIVQRVQAERVEVGQC